MAKALDKFCQYFNRVLLWAGGISLVAMILLTCANIFLRLVWLPVRGTFELMGFGGALVTAFGLGFTQIKRGHIAVDVLVDTFPAKVREFLTGFNYLVLSIFLAICGWQLWVKAGILWETEEVTETLNIIYYPVTYGVAVGCGFLALVFLNDLLKVIASLAGGEE